MLATRGSKSGSSSSSNSGGGGEASGERSVVMRDASCRVWCARCVATADWAVDNLSLVVRAKPRRCSQRKHSPGRAVLGDRLTAKVAQATNHPVDDGVPCAAVRFKPSPRQTLHSCHLRLQGS